jgi:glycosyltransferase involved in cell wall biosynthesis
MLLALAGELIARGHEVSALGPTGGEGWLTARFAELGVNRDLVEFSGYYGLGSVPRIASAIRKRGLDVLHSHDLGMAVAGALGARLAGCRHVITMHGGAYYSRRIRRRLALRVAMGMSHHTVAVSQALRRTMSESLWVREESMGVVHNGLAPREGTHGRVREELGVGPSDVLVVAVGNLYQVKGHAVLLEALSKLPAVRRRLVVAVAGSGPEEATLIELADHLGIATHVRLLGYRPDVHDLLAGADIFAMPSLSEGLPMAMIEAMLAGKAIVASAVGGIPELLPSSEFGLLVAPGDAAGLASGLAGLIDDLGRRERLGARARERALEHFTASAMAETYLSLYAD